MKIISRLLKNMKMSLTFFMFLIFVMLFPPFAQSEERSVTVKQKRDLAIEAKKGIDAALLDTKYHALIIGNNNYKYITKLKTAIADAKAVEKLLSEQYGFQTKILIDATRVDILDSLNEFRKIGKNDNLLIYYAGHGVFEKAAGKAYWLPVDAKSDSPSNWIIADDITSSIKRITSRHILIVSDSCYSGTLTRAVSGDLSKAGEREEFIKKMIERPSRTLMASGGNEPVADEGGSGHSVFADAFLRALKEADKGIFTAEELFHNRVKSSVAGKSDQVPEYNDIKNSGHDGGDFVFTLRTASLVTVSTPAPPPSLPAEAPLPPAPVVLQGHLQVNVNAPSARVYVNGEDKGTASPGSPLNMENLPTGTVTIRVEAEGYESGQKMVNIQRNQWTQEVFELKRIQVASLPPPPPPQITPPLKKGDEGGFNMVLIPAGEFMAGEPGSLKGMVLNAFYIDKYEVTQREYKQVMGENPSKFKGCDNCSIEKVTWFEADEYCRKVGKRLPTEWEWEKAAKGGTTSRYYWGESEGMAGNYAWYNKNSNGKTHPVGKKKPNAYGLYDMAGNVWEWTSSDYHSSVIFGQFRILRGGSWRGTVDGVRPSYHIEHATDSRESYLGFRCVP